MATSPRFPERRASLKAILTKPKLRSTWQDHVRQANRQQSLFDLMDYYDVHLDLDRRLDNVTDRIFRGVYKPGNSPRVLLEKSKGLCRQLIIPDPIDSLVLQTMVNAIMPQVLANQPNRNAFYQAQAHKISKSRKERIDEADYGSTVSWLSFQKAIFGFTRTHDYLVVTDIANFFDHVSFVELRNIYGSFQGINEDVLDFIFFILENYNWRPDYMPDKRMGLPQMNFDAPRLLAHSFLFELDRYLTRSAIGSYGRFMDDMDIGVASVGAGKKILRDIDLVLHARGVRLNSGKSKIMRADEAARYYFMRDNTTLNLVERTIERKRRAKPPNIQRELDFLTKKFKRATRRRGYFDFGNGEKVLKRYITLFIQHKIPISNALLRDFLYGRPAIREYALRYICTIGYTPARYKLIREYMTSNECIDDASIFACAKAIVDFKCPNTQKFRFDVLALSNAISGRGKVGFAAAIWLLSKLAAPSDLMNVVTVGFPVWSIDEWVGRQVGALYPRFAHDQALLSQFLQMIRQSRNGGAQSTYGLHRDMMRGQTSMATVYHYLKAMSQSQPRQVTLPKILLLMTFMRASAAPAGHKTNLRTIYQGVPLDGVEKALLKKLI